MAIMKTISELGPEKESLAEYTVKERKAPAIRWYRTPLPKEEIKSLYERSDWKGSVQTLGYLGILLLTFALALYSFLYWPWYVTAGLVFLHGMTRAFGINGVHELGHGTVLKTAFWNRFFCKILAVLSWVNDENFNASHTRHHRYTLHPPDDLEVVLPVRLMVRHFFLTGFIDVKGFWNALVNYVRFSRGRFQGEWELTLFPPDAPEKRRPSLGWARLTLTIHLAVAVVSLFYGLWIIPILFSLCPFIGGWLFFLCNNTQHIGLQDNVPDFRLCCRTFTLNPLVRFLYWQMNYHTEHHMYAAVPCYHLGQLHRLIRHDLPPCPAGLIQTWREIVAIQKRQEEDPDYQHQALLPGQAAPPA